MLFSKTYFCENEFFSYVYTKSENENRLQVELTLRIWPSNTDPTMADLVS